MIFTSLHFTSLHCSVRKLFTWFDRIHTTTPTAILFSVYHTKCAQRL